MGFFEKILLFYRQFLRMGIETIISPTLLMNSSKDNKSFVPLNRIKCLVSMTTVRDIRRETQILISPNSPTGITFINYFISNISIICRI